MYVSGNVALVQPTHALGCHRCSGQTLYGQQGWDFLLWTLLLRLHLKITHRLPRVSFPVTATRRCFVSVTAHLRWTLSNRLAPPRLTLVKGHLPCSVHIPAPWGLLTATPSFSIRLPVPRSPHAAVHVWGLCVCAREVHVFTDVRFSDWSTQRHASLPLPLLFTEAFLVIITGLHAAEKVKGPLIHFAYQLPWMLTSGPTREQHCSWGMSAGTLHPPSPDCPSSTCPPSRGGVTYDQGQTLSTPTQVLSCHRPVTICQHGKKRQSVMRITVLGG